MAELPERGDTELVKVTVKLKYFNAEDQALEVKKMLGPFGDVVPLIDQNALIISDTVKTLRTVIGIIREGDKGDVNESFTYKCKYIRARDAEERLAKLLGAKTEQPVAPPQQPRFGGGFFGGPPQFQMQQLQQQQAQNAPGKRSKTVVVTSDDNTNTVMVKGPPAAIGQAKAFLKEMDVQASAGDRPVVPGPRAWNTYDIPSSNAEALAKILSEQFAKKDPNVRISAVSLSRIMAYAYPEDHEAIAQFLNPKTVPTKAKTFGVGSLDAEIVVGILKDMFELGKTGVPFLAANTTTNSVFANGTAGQLKDVKEAIDALGGEPSLESGSTRIIGIGEGSAATLADALKTLMEGMGRNKVEVTKPGQMEFKDFRPAPKQFEEPPPMRKKLKLPKIDTSSALPGGQVFTQLVDPQEKRKEKAKDQKGKPGAGANHRLRQQADHQQRGSRGAQDGHRVDPDADPEPGRRRRFHGDPPQIRQRGRDGDAAQ